MDFPPVHILSIASGGGGLDLGVEAALHRLGRSTRHVAYVEIEAYACAVLASRMEEGNLAAAPIWTNLRTFDGRPFAGLVDLLVGGYPCQPFSLAGKRRGADDPRHLWPAIADLIRACRPGAVFFENVAGHLSLGAREVIGELQSLGYRVAAGLFTAEEIGAPHKRERLFILGVADAGCVGGVGVQSVGVTGGINPALVGCEGGSVVNAARNRRRERRPEHAFWFGDSIASAESSGSVGDADEPGLEGRSLRDGERPDERPAGTTGGPVADAIGDGCGGQGLHVSGGRSLAAVPYVSRAGRGHEVRAARAPFPPGPDDGDGWRSYLAAYPTLEPAVCRGADGLEHRLDRLRLLGNGVVPDEACEAFLSLAEDLAASYGEQRSAPVVVADADPPWL